MLLGAEGSWDDAVKTGHFAIEVGNGGFVTVKNPFDIPIGPYIFTSMPTYLTYAAYSMGRYQLTKTVQHGSPQPISEILHIEYRIVCCIETYLIHIYHMSKCSKCNWNSYIEGFCMWNVHFHINELSINIAFAILMSWPLMTIYLLSLNYWLFSVEFWYHI